MITAASKYGPKRTIKTKPVSKPGYTLYSSSFGKAKSNVCPRFLSKHGNEWTKTPGNKTKLNKEINSSQRPPRRINAFIQQKPPVIMQKKKQKCDVVKGRMPKSFTITNTPFNKRLSSSTPDPDKIVINSEEPTYRQQSSSKDDITQIPTALNPERLVHVHNYGLEDRRPVFQRNFLNERSAFSVVRPESGISGNVLLDKGRGLGAERCDDEYVGLPCMVNFSNQKAERFVRYLTNVDEAESNTNVMKTSQNFISTKGNPKTVCISESFGMPKNTVRENSNEPLLSQVSTAQEHCSYGINAVDSVNQPRDCKVITFEEPVKDGNSKSNFTQCCDEASMGNQFSNPVETDITILDNGLCEDKPERIIDLPSKNEPAKKAVVRKCSAAAKKTGELRRIWKDADAEGGGSDFTSGSESSEETGNYTKTTSKRQPNPSLCQKRAKLIAGIEVLKFLVKELKVRLGYDPELDRAVKMIQQKVNALTRLTSFDDLQTQMDMNLLPLRKENTELRRELKMLKEQMNKEKKQHKNNLKEQAQQLNTGSTDLCNLYDKEHMRRKQLEQEKEVLTTQMENLKKHCGELEKALEERNSDKLNIRQDHFKENQKILKEKEILQKNVESLKFKLESSEQENRVLQVNLERKDEKVGRLQHTLQVNIPTKRSHSAQKVYAGNEKFTHPGSPKMGKQSSMRTSSDRHCPKLDSAPDNLQGCPARHTDLPHNQKGGLLLGNTNQNHDDHLENDVDARLSMIPQVDEMPPISELPLFSDEEDSHFTQSSTKSYCTDDETVDEMELLSVSSSEQQPQTNRNDISFHFENHFQSVCDVWKPFNGNKPFTTETENHLLPLQEENTSDNMTVQTFSSFTKKTNKKFMDDLACLDRNIGHLQESLRCSKKGND